MFRQSLAYAEKDLNTNLRFKVDFFAGTFLPALVSLGLFGTVFFGVFKVVTGSLSGINGSNFVAYVLLGALTATLFNQTFGAYQSRFLTEKYWETAYAILASPLSSWAILFGVGISEMVKFTVVATLFLVASYLIYPVSPLTALIAVAFLTLVFVVISGIALIGGAVSLVNENFGPLLNYFLLGAGYLACFYYPFTFLPSFLQPLASVNPLYYAVYSFRAIWLGFPLQPEYVVFVLAAAVLSPLLGTYVFQKIWRNLDITGY